MSDKNIRIGLRELQAIGPEEASQIFDLDTIRKFVTFAENMLAFAEHNNGKCNHCYPKVWTDPIPSWAESEHNAIITETGCVISSSCKLPGNHHPWCMNRNWTETSCSCECHCFVKNFYNDDSNS